MPAPRKYPKTTELRPNRNCQVGWFQRSVEGPGNPVVFEGIDPPSCAAEDALTDPASQFSAQAAGILQSDASGDFTCAPGADRVCAQELQRAVTTSVGAQPDCRVHGDVDAGDPGGAQDLCLVRRGGVAGRTPECTEKPPSSRKLKATCRIGAATCSDESELGPEFRFSIVCLRTAANELTALQTPPTSLTHERKR
jgi:hypothetical protein